MASVEIKKGQTLLNEKVNVWATELLLIAY
jgi:hypothetical protein